jgi:hypothetical protein
VLYQRSHATTCVEIITKSNPRFAVPASPLFALAFLTSAHKHFGVKQDYLWRALARLVAAIFVLGTARASVVDKQALLDAQTFWDNRDWDWYRANIPFFECPDREINTTYYYRWELVTKHLTYGSIDSGYSFTEFIDRPFWSGAYGAISCPAGHQLYEARWLRDERYSKDYARYWFHTPGAQPRRYSTWLADAVWAMLLAQGDDGFARALLPDFIDNYRGWEKDHFVPEVGMFWQIGHDDGMEYNINSRQTSDIVQGGPGYRPSFNSYMWADMQAIANVAEAAGESATASEFRSKAAALKNQMQASLWDPARQFFINRFKNDERDAEGNIVKAFSFTYETGKFAGNPHGREEIGFVPWQFNMPDAGFESAWQFLMKPDYFSAPFGPTTVEKNDPLFVLQPKCCWWSGMSWPYATTQTLKAMANLLQNYRQNVVTRADYFSLLRTYALTQRKDGRPYIAEAANPDTGSYSGHDSPNHSEHYFHSGFNDLVITGLIGLKPRTDETVELDPLAPTDWPWFALDDVPYHGHLLSIIWDQDGSRYHRGPGFQVIADGRKIASSQSLGKITAILPKTRKQPSKPGLANYAVNNDKAPYPRVNSSLGVTPALSKINDGNYWYHVKPANRWTSEGSTNASDWVEVDFGQARKITVAKLFVLDDENGQVAAPKSIVLEYWDENRWRKISSPASTPSKPLGHRPFVRSFPALSLSRLRATFVPQSGKAAGFSEFEAWGEPVALAGTTKIHN